MNCFHRRIVFRGVWMAMLVALLHGGVLAADRQPAWAVPLAGQAFRATLVNIDDGGITLDTQGQTRNMVPAELVQWGTLRDDAVAARVILRDGSVIVADVLDVARTSITVESGFWPTTQIVREAVGGIVFNPPAGNAARDRLLQRIRSERLTNDLTLLKNGDEISGRLTAAPDGTVAGDDFGLFAFGVQTRAARPAIPVAVGDTTAVLLGSDTEQPRAASPVTWLGLQDGSLLAAAKVDQQAGEARLTLACGQRLLVPAGDFWQHVELVQPLGTVRYLSDLTPLSYQHSPYLALQRSLGRDRNVLGGQLRRAGNPYLKGLGMPTTSRVLYAVTAEDRRFSATLALDDAAGRGGSVVYRVFLERPAGGDSATAWQAAFTSPVVRGGDPPRAMSVDLDGAKTIALIVDYADRGDARDYANWLNARFSP